MVAVHSQLVPICIVFTLVLIRIKVSAEVGKISLFSFLSNCVLGIAFLFMSTYLSKLLDCPADVCGYRFRSLGLKSLKRFCCRLL